MNKQSYLSRAHNWLLKGDISQDEIQRALNSVSIERSKTQCPEKASDLADTIEYLSGELLIDEETEEVALTASSSVEFSFDASSLVPDTDIEVIDKREKLERLKQLRLRPEFKVSLENRT